MGLRTTNAVGLAIVKHYEGFSATVYLDPGDIPTIGYGSTYDCKGKRVTMSHKRITEEEGAQLLARDLGVAERAVIRNVWAHLNDNEFSALVSFTYNLGGGALQRSTLRRMLNRGDRMDAADEFPKWRRAGGRILRGLVLRRADERQLFLN